MNYVWTKRLMSGLYPFVKKQKIRPPTLVIEFVPWRNLETKFMGHFMSLVFVDYVA